MFKEEHLLKDLADAAREALKEKERRERLGLTLVCVEIPKETYEILRWKAKKHYDGNVNRLLSIIIDKYIDSSFRF